MSLVWDSPEHRRKKFSEVFAIVLRWWHWVVGKYIANPGQTGYNFEYALYYAYLKSVAGNAH